MQARRQMRRLSKYLLHESLDRGRDSRRRNSFPRTPSVARGASAPREPSVGLYNKVVAKFCKDSDEGLAQSIPEGQAKGRKKITSLKKINQPFF